MKSKNTGWFIVLFIIGTSQLLFAQSNWKNIGPGGGSDLHFLAVQPDDADICYVGGDIEGIFKTIDGGQTWQNINNNLTHLNYGADVYWINDIVIDPVDYQWVFLCTAVGLFMTENGGQSWNLLFPKTIIAEDDPIMVSTVAIDPINTDRIYLGLGESTDGTFADFKPFEDSDELTGLYRSTNGGDDWEEIASEITDKNTIHSIVVNPLNTQQVVMATTKGIYSSDNSGNSWVPKNNGLPHTNCHRLKGQLSNNVYHLFLSVKVLGSPGNAASFSGGLFTSNDMGDTWIDITSNLPKYDPYDQLFYDYWKFDVHPVNPNIIYTGTVRGSGYEEPGIYATWDGGGSWEMIHFQHEDGWLDLNWFWEPYIFDIQVAPSNPNQVVTCLDWVEMSSDGGTTWAQKYTTQVNGGWQGNGLELMNTDAIAFHPTDSDIFYVGYDDMGLFRTEDGGNSFIRLDTAQDPIIDGLSDADGLKDILVDPANGDLYISRWQGSMGGYPEYSSGGIVYSSDMGDHVTDISNDLPSGRCDLVLDEISGTPGNRILYCTVYHHGVYKTTNSGQSWTEINNNLGNNKTMVWEITLDHNNSQILYLGLNFIGGGTQNFYRSIDGGENWSSLSSFPAGDVLSVNVDRSGNVYASMTDDFDWNYTGGLYKSTNGGESWMLINDHPRIIDVQVHPSNLNVIVSAGQIWYKPDEYGARLDISTDVGETWSDYSSGMNHTVFNFARFDPHDSGRLFVGTAGGGLWVKDDVFTSIKNEMLLSLKFNLKQNYPNPFNPTTNIEYELFKNDHVKLVIYNTLGQKIRTLIDEPQLSGNHIITWDGLDEVGQNVPTGQYYYCIIQGNNIVTKKAILLK